MTEGTNNNIACNASKIADFFVTEFYSRLKKDPSTLYELYHDSGYLTWVGCRSEMMGDDLSFQPVIRAETKEKIRSAISLLELNNCTTYVEVLECSKSVNNSLFITAKGRMYIGECEDLGRCFVQSFLLTEIRPRWYFIRNDCLIFLDSELPLKQCIQATAKIANMEPMAAKCCGKRQQIESSPEAMRPKEPVHLNNTHIEVHNEVEQQTMMPMETVEESHDLSGAAMGGAHVVVDSQEEPQNTAEVVCDNAHIPVSTSATTIAHAPSNNKPVHPSPLDPANYVDSFNAKDNANMNRSSPNKYEVTSYAGKLMGGALKTGNKVKGYAIHVPAEDKNKAFSQNGSAKKSPIQKDPKTLKEAKNKRKIFVHSLPTNVSDDQIREAVLNQLKVHGGGYVIDIERARATGRHWGILELDSEFSCKTLLENGLYLGGMEISIGKWKQFNPPQNQNNGQNSSRFNKNSNRHTAQNYHNSANNAKH